MGALAVLLLAIGYIAGVGLNDTPSLVSTAGFLAAVRVAFNLANQ
jgi:hypothetical protein